MGKETVVYTSGTFDMFHIGHLNLLRQAKGMGDRLIVGVSTDEVVEDYKPGKLVISFEDRIQIVAAISFVDAAVPQRTRDKYEAWERLRYDVLVVGDDWYGREEFRGFERRLQEVEVRTVYLPYTNSVSSTILRKRLGDL